jgi:uncharacterized membrane protein HdeD (DUF308 family)
VVADQVSTIETQSMLALLGRNWWTVVLRGVIAVLLGLAALGWPQITLEVLVILLGAYLLVDGAFAIFTGVRDRSRHRQWWLLLLEGLAGIVAGAIALFLPGITALVLIYVLAAWALITGILEILAAIRLREELRGEWLLVLGGVASILFALIVALRPTAGMIALVWLIAIYAIIFGILFIILGLRLRSWARQE